MRRSRTKLQSRIGRTRIGRASARMKRRKPLETEKALLSRRSALATVAGLYRQRETNILQCATLDDAWSTASEFSTKSTPRRP